jgi:hypothetical protein
MLKLIVDNFFVLKNAIGVEPPMQIFMNAIRKVIGRPPKHRNATLVFQDSLTKYQEYLNSRSVYFDNHLPSNDHKHGIDLIWLVQGSKESIMEVWDSVRRQKIKFSSIKIVTESGINLPFNGVYSIYESLEDACLNCNRDYVFFLNGDSHLHTALVQECKMQIERDPIADIFYTCDDFTDLDGLKAKPRFKPQFNKYLLYNKNYIGQNLLVKRRFGDSLNWFDASFKSAFMYDFLLRAIDKSAKIVRIAEVLIHHMKVVLPESIEERKKALQQHLIRNNDFAQVRNGL